MPSFAGQLSNARQRLLPLSNSVASARSSLPLPLSQKANHGAWISSRKYFPVALPKSMSPTFWPSLLDQLPWYQGPMTR